MRASLIGITRRSLALPAGLQTAAATPSLPISDRGRPFSTDFAGWLNTIAAKASTGSPPVTQSTANTGLPTAPPDDQAALLARTVKRPLPTGLSSIALQDTMQIGEPERLFEQRRRPRHLVGEKIPPAQGDRGNPERRAASAQHDPLLAAQHEVGDQHIDRRSRQPHLRLDDILARDNIVAELGQNAGDELANCSIRFGQKNARHRLL